MSKQDYHSFHIPVMGLGYTIDTPIKVARFGISSVISIIEDNLIERMREFYCKKLKVEFVPIGIQDVDHRTKRIIAYLNLIDKVVNSQIVDMKLQPFEGGQDIVKYFEMLPENSLLKKEYLRMLSLENGKEKIALQNELRTKVKAGCIDVNIMTKCDRMNYDDNGNTLPVEFADAMSALRGFAYSTLSSSVIFSAGMNPRLYSYCESFSDFTPDKNGNIKKKIVLKVSDHRSALIQGKFLAKKGLWVSEFRIESGLNCGGHAFPTEGLLLGPILQEFYEKRNDLLQELFIICNDALHQKNKYIFAEKPEMKITVQGGIGTAAENKMLLEHYYLDGTGWGSPFLLVPEVTNVDDDTLNQLSNAKKEDYFLSYVSPLGLAFNNFRKSTSEQQRKNRIEKKRPGSPCYKKFLAFNTEFTDKPICTASREYQHLKIKSLKTQNLTSTQLEDEINRVTEKDCLCEGLGAGVLIKNGLTPAHNLTAITICPAPNLAYFSGVFSLSEMVNHIYGRINILNSLPRPHMFVNELKMYADYLKKEIDKNIVDISQKQKKYLTTFQNNLMEGINYYKSLVPKLKYDAEAHWDSFMEELSNMESKVMELVLPDSITTS